MTQLEPEHPPGRHCPASAEVYRHVRRRMRKLSTVRKLSQPQQILQDLDVREIESIMKQEHLSLVDFQDLYASEKNYEHKAARACEWLVSVLQSHMRLLGREHEMRMFRFAIEKELAGAQADWSDMERLYMVLTNFKGADAGQGLKMAFIWVLQLNFADTLGPMGKLAAQRCEARERVLQRDSQVEETRVKIIDRLHEIKVDHFACAVPLSCLRPRPDVIDDNEGSCPVCQNSYSDLGGNTAQELLSDYPVRIKYCGHIIGKACLERWIMTPKIDVAKYPHRTCPLCRVKIEGVRAPSVSSGLNLHLKRDRRAMENLRELADGWDMEYEECLETIVACMSAEIAGEELLALIDRQKGKTRWGFEKDEKILRETMEGVNKEKWAWGFRGDHAWRQLRDEWMKSGVVRQS
ncbi:hypothetical protein EK21DRAFT_118545 [Setomelanomma holmii]|uniref:RING-type domain-containing protein n=1 Tax=Setomelanomma holmii TaxID=210430 RepID=A0A9P4GY67_9PLEO|nr:hypothetical protein EK21DRAFT_118545 [Setomelanomma holmii]